MPDQSNEADNRIWLELFELLLQTPEIRETVTFRRFLELIEILAHKLKTGEDASAERAEMVSLRRAIDIEMRSLHRRGTIQ